MTISAYGQESINQKTIQSLEQTDALLESFSRKCERCIRKAERCFDRYGRNMTKSDQTAGDSKPDPKTRNPKLKKVWAKNRCWTVCG